MGEKAFQNKETRTAAANVAGWLVNVAALLVAAWALDGVVIEKAAIAFAAALVLSLVTLFVEPVLYLLALPITVATFGLFTLVLNGVVLMITASLVPWFRFAGGFWERLGWAVAASLVVGLFRTIARSVMMRAGWIKRQ